MSFKDLASKEHSLKKPDGKDNAAVSPASPTAPATADSQRREEAKD